MRFLAASIGSRDRVALQLATGTPELIHAPSNNVDPQLRHSHVTMLLGLALLVTGEELYVAVSRGNGTAIYVSVDEGTSWRLRYAGDG